MRTVTFADAKVREALGGFALAWKNIKDDPSCGSSYRHDPGEAAMPLLRGIGNHNVQLLFLTPDAKLVHVLAGYWGPRDLVREIELVRKLIAAAKEGKDKVAALHREHAREDAPAMDDDGGRLLLNRDLTKRLEESRCLTGWKSSHDFMSKNALLPVEKYRAQDLVGEGESFFGARVSGGTTTVVPARKASKEKRYY